MRHKRNYRRHGHRSDSNLPKTFGTREALGVTILCWSELFRMAYTGISDFWRVTHSIHYKI